MDFGRPAELDALARSLRSSADDSDDTVRRTHQKMSALPDEVDQYQRRSAGGYQRSWLRAHEVLLKASRASHEISTSLTALGTELTSATQAWTSAYDEATSAGFTVHEADRSISVSTPSGATDAQTHHATALETRMRHAVDLAERARHSVSGRIESLSVSGIEEFHAAPAAVPSAQTGDGSLDALIRHRCAQLIGLHDKLAAHRSGQK